MWIILALLLSVSALALEPFERLKGVKILKVLPRNIILLNRGLEDGLMKNDHIKISNGDEGYASRAICVRAHAETSWWKLYRVPSAEAFSLDYSYTITGLADREIPFPEAKIRDMDQEVAENFKIKSVDPGKNPFDIKRDLPEKLTERDLIEATGPDQRKLFIEQAINQDQLKRDLTDFKLSLFASPFSRQSINSAESYRYGFKGGNIGSKYRLLTQFEQQQSNIKDPVTKENVSTRSTSAQAQFVIHRVSNSFSSLSLVNYNSNRFSYLYTPRSHTQIGVIGFTWHMFENKTWEYFDLSYVPLYDTRTTDIITPVGQSTDKTNGLRHGFRLGVRTKINERVAFENLLWVRPYQDLATWEVEADNLNLVNDMKLIFNISGNLYFDYNFIYQKDKLWRTLSGLSENNTINSLNLRYDLNL
jgi:hypothetical protein